MEQLSFDDATQVSGAGVVDRIASYLIIKSLEKVYDAVMSGQVDYAGLAESQGTYYNTVGA